MSKKAFTLIELLVVVVIIAILSVIGYASYTQTRIKARDSQRKSDIEAIAAALKMYKAEHHIYPDTGVGTTCLRRIRSGSANLYWKVLETKLQPFMASAVYGDPVNISNPNTEDIASTYPIWRDTNSYNYTLTTNSQGNAFILAARLETDKGNGTMLKHDSLYGCGNAIEAPIKERYPIGSDAESVYKISQLWVVSDNTITVP